mgnify:CR=1 FL=1
MKKEKNIIKVQRYESPCGLLLLGSFGDKLCLCDWQVEKHRDHVDRRLKRMLCAEFEVGTSEVIEKAARQLDEFFAGKRKEFDVPLLFVGTDFQKAVWNKLLEIPFGKTVSYGEMAQRIGMSKAVRAVANANGANSISIFAPCHRVIGSDHSLTGYGGGLPAKKFLLDWNPNPDWFCKSKVVRFVSSHDEISDVNICVLSIRLFDEEIWCLICSKYLIYASKRFLNC